MDAIPTEYNGLLFRSRLEATWAAFFDKLRWPWKYEPIDLRGYIPDFILPFPWSPLLVEVKPAVCFDELENHAPAIEHSGWDKDAMIVGTGLMVDSPEPTWGHPCLGLVSQRDFFGDIEGEFGGDPGWCWGPAMMHCCPSCNSMSFHHAWQSWNCYICGCYQGNAGICIVNGERISGLWAEAQNLARWQPERQRAR